MSTMLQLRNPFENPFGPRSGAMPYQQPGSPKSNHSEQPSTTSPSASMGPPSTNSPEVEQNGISNGPATNPTSQTGAAAVGASQGPKVVQTAFIHKLYSMLEDKSIQHLISWSNNGDSFVMSPSNEFSKVLAQYFKHTNISSFVRQLNMYGFHKVSDVFHTGSAESALWEFRHGNGNFKKGDLLGLREIKRRASRHTLIHRDSFTNTKPGPTQPGTPAEVITDPEQRLAQLESILYDMNARLARSEDNYSLMSSRCQSLAESLGRCHGWISHLSSAVQHSTGPETALHSDMVNMQKEISRQQELVRSLEQPLEVGINGNRSHFYGSAMALDGPVSPRGYAFSESRRSSIQMQEPPPAFGARPPVPPIPPQFNTAPSPRRFGSISATQTSPGFSKPPLPTPSQPHPLSNVVSPPLNLARRHTSADIREHGWPLPNTNSSPYASGQNSVQWQPSSPQQQPQDAGDQQLQSQLANYQINGSRRPTITAADQESVPPSHIEPPASGLGVGGGSWGVGNNKFPRPNFELHSAPATRRSSMASNVHSLLNPADTVEQENEDEGAYDDRKRKRLA